MLCSPTADSFINHPNPTLHINKDVRMEATRIPCSVYQHLTIPPEISFLDRNHHGMLWIFIPEADKRKRNETDYEKEIEREINQAKARIRWLLRLKKVHMRRSLKMKIPRLMRRKAARVVMAKVLKRLKESGSHLGDLFAGNYLFMQVAPTPLKSSSSR